jgi:5-formyltetrahydrofolate cyclo-ligase
MKDRIRAVIRDRRESLPANVMDECAKILSENLTDFVKEDLGLDLSKITVASYMPVRGEISSIPFCLDVLAKGGKVMMPRVNGSEMEFYYVNDLRNDVEDGTYGLKEPKLTCAGGSASDCDIVIVPAIAYNDEGIRLGQGGGYYDRLWKDLGGDSPDRKNVIVGICYDFQMISSIPVDENDMVCDVIFAVPTEEE